MERVEGKVLQVLGPVVDVKFEGGRIPEIYNAIQITSEGFDTPNPIDITLEVAQHLGEGAIKCVSMQPTDGLGRVMNVLGEPVDERGPVKAENRYPIHRPAPSLEDQNTDTEMLETGIKVIDLIEPFSKGGKIGLFGGAGKGCPAL